MSCRSFYVVLAIAFIVSVAGEFKLPSTIKICKRGTDDYSSCLRLALQESWPTIVEGIPEWNLAPLDPFFVEHEVDELTSNEIRGTLEEKNIYIYGMKNARFHAVRPEYSDNFFKLEVDLSVPKILAEGEYNATGTVVSFKIGGKGHFNISAGDAKITWEISGPVKDNRWIVEHFKPQVQLGTMKIWCEDLFNGNEELTKVILNFINELWPTLYRAIFPFLSQTWDKICTKFLKPILAEIPFDEIFPSV